MSTSWDVRCPHDVGTLTLVPCLTASIINAKKTKNRILCASPTLWSISDPAVPERRLEQPGKAIAVDSALLIQSTRAIARS